MPGLASTTAAGLTRRITGGQRQAVKRGLAAVTGRMLALLTAARAAAALTAGPVTIDLDATDAEDYGRKKRGVAYNHQGQRSARIDELLREIDRTSPWAGPGRRMFRQVLENL